MEKKQQSFEDRLTELEELVRKMEGGSLPLSEALPPAPRHIFGDGHALVLRHSRHDRKNEAALGIECVDIFLLEYALDAVLFELTDCGNTVNYVASETAYALRQNQRKLFRQRVVHHLLKTVAMAYPRSAHAIVIITAGEFVIRAGCEQFLVMRPLVFQAVLLLVRARRYPQVASRLPARQSPQRRHCVHLACGFYFSYNPFSHFASPSQFFSKSTLGVLMIR